MLKLNVHPPFPQVGGTMQPFEHVTRQLFPNHVPRTNVGYNANNTPLSSVAINAPPESSTSANPTESPLSSLLAGTRSTVPGLPVAPRTVRTFACGHVIPSSQVGHRVRTCVPDVLSVHYMKYRCSEPALRPELANGRSPT